MPTGTHGPMECLDLMALDFKSHIFQAFAQIPSYSSWLVDKADLTSTYAYERRVLKLLQWGEPPRPWRLKSPVARAVARRPRRGLPRRPLRDDAPRSRPTSSCRWPTCTPTSSAASPITSTADYLGELNVEHWSVGMQRALAVPRRRGRSPVLRHRLSRHAGRSDRRGPRPVRLAGRTGHRRVRIAGCARGGPRTPRTRAAARQPTRRRSDSTSTRSGRCSPTTSHRMEHWHGRLSADMAIDLDRRLDADARCSRSGPTTRRCGTR